MTAFPEIPDFWFLAWYAVCVESAGGQTRQARALFVGCGRAGKRHRQGWTRKASSQAGAGKTRKRVRKTQQQIDMEMLTGTNEAYEAFVDKFKPKLTTDDCYTPENIYSAIRDWVFARYDLPEDTQVVRPFWPGADYKSNEYPEGCVVIDNPPFSILADIEKWFMRRDISFFLFAPSLTIFKPLDGLNYVLADAEVIYENGARVRTGFVTNLGENMVESAPELYRIVKKIGEENARKGKPGLQTYEYPDHVLTASVVNKLSKYGISFSVRREHTCFVRYIDAQKEKGKGIFGAGFLLSDKAAAEKAAAEKAAADKAAAEKANAYAWALSEREKEIVKSLGK